MLVFYTKGSVTGANVGTGAGQIFRDKTGNTLNFKTLSTGQDIIITNNANDVNIATNGTPLNTPSTLVQRDGSGNFAASTITAALTGAASLNVLKAGDTMTGNLNMALQSQVRFQDFTGSGNYVGLNAPATVSASYDVNLPASAPLVGQFLQATSPTALQWATVGGAPALAKTYYVAVDGSDSNDGSFSAPFLTISHALSVVNPQASVANPIVISVGAGLFFEDNSGGPLTISADGISIIGTSISATTVFPLDVAVDLFSITTANVAISNLRLAVAFGTSTASAINFNTNSAGTAQLNSLSVGGFQTGFSLNSAQAVPSVIVENAQMGSNGTCIAINNVTSIIQNSFFAGPAVIPSPPANTGISTTGIYSQTLISACALAYFGPAAVLITGGSRQRILASDFENSLNGVVCLGASHSSMVGCNFILSTTNSIDVSASGANTQLIIEACNLDCSDNAGTPRGTGIMVSNGAEIALDSCNIQSAVVGISCGVPGDTSSTILAASGAIIKNCTTDIIQQGSSTLSFFSGTFDSNQISIANPTNVNFAAFNDQAQLVIGSGADITHPLYEVLNGQASLQNLTYQPSYYRQQRNCLPKSQC